MIPVDRSERQTDFNEQQRAWTGLFFSLVLFGMAALFYFGGEGGVFSYVAALPALFGVLLLFGVVQSLFASRTAPTTIILSSEFITRGENAPLTIRQYGPAHIESLQVDLICEKSVRKAKSRDLTYPFHVSFFDSGAFHVSHQSVKEFQTTIPVPPDADPSGDGDIRITWRLQIWGKVIGGADFRRPFEVVVK